MVSKKLCRDCDEHFATHGVQSDPVTTWCGSCAGKHEGAFSIQTNKKKCEDCRAAVCTYGLEGEAFDSVGNRLKLRWCTTCAKVCIGPTLIVPYCQFALI
jgi:hypothetical protein